MSFATSSGGVSPLVFDRPVVVTETSKWVTAGRTLPLLDVKRTTTTTSADGVSLVVSFTK